MNEDERDRRSDDARDDAAGETRPPIVSYDPYFPVAPSDAEPRTVVYDPYFAQDGASDFG